MSPKNIDAYFENDALKNEFALRQLDLAQVWQPSPDDIESENCELRNLLDWVVNYQECRSRRSMEKRGYKFPPIMPAIDPDSDWLRFRRWLQGKPVRRRLKSRLPRELVFMHPHDLTEEEIEHEVERLTRLLARMRFSVDLHEGVPPRSVYEHLLEVLEDDFELVAGGCWHLDGCSGCCPECFQRPWCETGGKSCWREDVEAGHMVFPENARRYVSPSPVSLSILRREQKKEDRRMAQFMQKQDRENQGGDDF